MIDHNALLNYHANEHFPDATADGKIYGRKNNAWAEMIGGGASVTVSDTAPTGAAAGNLWWESDTGILYIFFNDGTSSQWVAITSIGSGGGGGGTPSTANPIMNGIAAPGTATPYSREDHIHPTDTSRAALTQVVRYDAAQGLTAVQQSQARSNIGLAAAYGILNQSLAVSAASGALTISLKDANGNDPSAASPVIANLRNASGTGTGSWVSLTVTAPLSLTIPSGAGMAVGINAAFRLWVVVFSDAGTPRLGVVNCAGVSAIFPLVDKVVAVTAISASSNTAGVIYASVATTTAFQIVGYVEWIPPGLAVSGTWTTTNLFYVQSFGPGVKKPGDIVQSAQALVGGDTTTSATFVNVAGSAIVVQPTSAANRMLVSYMGRSGVAAGGAGVNTEAIAQIAFNGTIIGTQIIVGVVSASGTNIQTDGTHALSLLHVPNSIGGGTYTLQHKGLNTNGVVSTTTVGIVHELMV